MFKSKNVTAKVLKIVGLLLTIGAIAVGIMTGSSYTGMYPFSVVFFSSLMTALPALIGGVALYALGEIIDLLQAFKDKLAPAEEKEKLDKDALAAVLPEGEGAEAEEGIVKEEAAETGVEEADEEQSGENDK